MNELMTVGKVFVSVVVLVLALFQMMRIIDNISDSIHHAVNEYVDGRIRTIVWVDKDMIYSDLERLHPNRLARTRHGGWYVKSKNVERP